MFLKRLIPLVPLLGIFLIPPLAPASEDNPGGGTPPANPPNFVQRQQPSEAIEGAPGLGHREINRPDGSETTYYSIVTQEEKEKKRNEEKEKIDRSWDMLQNIFIIPRSR